MVSRLKEKIRTAKLAKKQSPGPWDSDYCGDVFSLSKKEYDPNYDAMMPRSICSSRVHRDPDHTIKFIADHDADYVVKLYDVVEKSVHLINNLNPMFIETDQPLVDLRKALDRIGALEDTEWLRCLNRLFNSTATSEELANQLSVSLTTLDTWYSGKEPSEDQKKSIIELSRGLRK